MLVDGRPLAAYVRAYLAGDRVYVPVSPLLTRIADRMWFEGNTLVIERAGRRVRVPLSESFRGELDGAYVEAGPVLRALGESALYDGKYRQLEIRTQPLTAIALPTPFSSPAPTAPPNAVFTPAPVATPRPVWTGSPLPRRTPLPIGPPAT